MIKRILAVVMAAMLIIALVGCGKAKRTPINVTLSTEDADAISGLPESTCPTRKKPQLRVLRSTGTLGMTRSRTMTRMKSSTPASLLSSKNTAAHLTMLSACGKKDSQNLQRWY